MRVYVLVCLFVCAYDTLCMCICDTVRVCVCVWLCQKSSSAKSRRFRDACMCNSRAIIALSHPLRHVRDTYMYNSLSLCSLAHLVGAAARLLHTFNWVSMLLTSDSLNATYTVTMRN